MECSFFRSPPEVIQSSYQMDKSNGNLTVVVVSPHWKAKVHSNQTNGSGHEFEMIVKNNSKEKKSPPFDLLQKLWCVTHNEKRYGIKSET